MFRTKHKYLKDSYLKKKDAIVHSSPKPICEICDYCWYQGKCLLSILHGDKPITCCIFQLFSKNKELDLENVVKYVCSEKCVERQKWLGDPVPHTKEYCERHCPMSRYILDIKASNYDDVPHNF